MSKAKEAWEAYQALTHEEKIEYLEIEKESLEGETRELENLDLQMQIIKAFKPIEDGVRVGKRAVARKVILMTISDMMEKYPELRFTQVLNNLNINQQRIVPAAEGGTGDFVEMIDPYNHKDEEVASRVTSAYLKITNNE